MSERHVSIGMTPVEDTTRIPMYLDVTRIVEAVSPHVTLTRTEGGVEITVQDVDGTHTATVYDGADGTDGSDAVDVLVSTLTFNLPCDADGKALSAITKYFRFAGFRGGELAACTLKSVTANQPTSGVTVRRFADGTGSSWGQIILQATAGAYPIAQGIDIGTWSLTFTVDGVDVLKTFEVAAVRQGEKGTALSARIAPLNGSALSVDNTVDVDGVPEYVSDVSQYSSYGITEAGWYVFARIAAKAGVSVTAQTTVAGADGYIATVGADHIDVAVRFAVAAMAKQIAIAWGGETETFVFRATDLAVRNLDYRTTFYLFDLAAYVTWQYALTTDATFVAGKRYFVLDGEDYVEAVEGTDWAAGDAVTADTYYNHSKLHIEGMTRNVTYKLDEIVDAPIEIALPVVADDGYGAWFEFQLRYGASYSCTLLPPEGVKIGTVSTQNQTAGINVIDLQYTGVGGVRMWSLLNTHSNIPA